MSWKNGVDLVAIPEGADQPSLIVHFAEAVTTPRGTAPAGMVLIQDNPAEAPKLMGFVSSEKAIAEYFGPGIFTGTPFEQAPALVGDIQITAEGDTAQSRIEINDFVIECRLVGLGELEYHLREPQEGIPFHQSVVERIATQTELTLNGQPIAHTLPPVGISGGAPAVFAPSGIYARP